MTSPVAARLYTPELLALAVRLANYPLDPVLPLTGEARSRICGGSIYMGLETDGAGRIVNIGMQVTACAIGQSAAAIFAAAAPGQSHRAIAASLKQIEGWLDEGGDLPDWPGFTALSPARVHTGRHGAIVLPWNAALAALCKAGQAG